MVIKNKNINKFFSLILVCALIFNIIGINFQENKTFASNLDGSAHLNMTMTPSISSSGVVAGNNFTYSVSLKNEENSDGDAFKYGYILQLPTNVSFVSSPLGTPNRVVNHNSGSTLVFFKTNLPLLKGLSKNNSFVLNTSSGAVGLTKNIKILAYANDNIYGVGKPPVGSPPSTLTGGIDFANSAYYTGTTNFPDNIIASSDLTNLPFTGLNVNVIPFDVSKSESSNGLVGNEVTSTITITNNNLGPISDLNIQDIIPKNRKFVSFTSTGGVGEIDITYDSPNIGETKIDFNNIDIPTGNTLNISYKTLLLSHDLLSSSGAIFNNSNYTNNGDSSINQAITHTGGLAAGANQTYWNNGISNIAVNSGTLPGIKTANTHINFANISKSVDKAISSIGDILTYTIDVDVSKEFDLESGSGNTYIDDIIPDGMVFSGMLSSTIVSGNGTAFNLSGTGTDGNGNTTVRWNLPSGVIEAGSKARIIYQTHLDGNFEGTGPIQYINNDTLVNTATLTYQVGGNYSDIWGNTEGALINNIYTDSASASTRAPTPTMNKQLVKVVVPGGQTYDSSNPLGVNDRITVGSKLTFAISASFPDVYFTGIILKDALPLLTGPNNQVYDIAFQNIVGLKDMYGNDIFINDNDGNGTADNSFNGNTLNGTTSVGNNSWLSISDPNYINFNLGSGNGGNKFSILFTVDILPTAPETIDPDGLHPLLNVATGEYRNAGGTLYSDLLKEVPFTIALPALNVTKTASGSNIAYGDQVDYTVTITNSGAAPAYTENILDVIPANMNLDTWSIVYSGSLSNINNSNITQNGTGLTIEFGTGTSGSSRSLVPINNNGTPTIKENIIVINYTLKPTVDFIVGFPTTRTNTVTLDYYSTHDVASQEVNNYGPITASASFTPSVPTIGRTLFSTTESDSTTNNLYIGEEATFDTTIYLSGGTYLNSYFNDTADTNLQYLSGEILSYSGNLNFNTGATFSSTGYINFGTLVNDDNNKTTKEAIILRTTYRLKNTAIAGTNKVTTGRFYYNTTNISATSNVNYRLPTTTIVKSVNPTSADASDIVTYSIKVTNTSTTAHGYDYILTDIMPSGVAYVPGSLTGNVIFSGTDSDFFSGSGIIIDKLNPNNGSGTITYSAEISTGSIAGQVKNNIVNMSLSTLDDDNSAYEKTYTGTSNVNLNIKDISINHSITATNLSDTASSKYNASYPDIAIGEEVTYRININLSELDYTGVTLTQTLPAGIKFLTGSIITDNVLGHSLSTITLSGTTQIIFNFGDISNLGGTGTGFILETKAVVLDNSQNTAGTTKNSVIRIDYNSSNFKTNNTPNFDIVEPNLSIVKDYSPNSGDGGDTIPTTITITNNGSAPAYDITVSDFTPTKITTGAGFYSSTGITVINPGTSITYNYNSTLNSSVTYGELLTGTASVIYNSYPGSPLEGEKSYSGNSTDTISITGLSGLSKTLETSDKVKIADKSSYKIAFPIPEGLTDKIVITDNISTGMIINPGSITITNSAGVTYSGTVSPVYNISSDSIGAGNSQTLNYTFDNIVNTDTNNAQSEYIYIDYDTVIVNSGDNNNGDTKTSPVSADYNNGTTILNASPIPVTVEEPNISLNINKVYTNGYSAEVLFTVTNNGGTGAYDVTLDTLLTSGLSYTGSIILTNSGTAVNLVKSGDNFTIDYLGVNTGNPLTFKLNSQISNSVANGQTLYVTGNLQYTSQNSSYSPLLSNVLDTERNGTNSPVVNDYFTSGNTSLLTSYAILNEYISVDKSIGTIGEKFTYTIRLENTGSINLTNINVNLNISDSFTGFSVTSIPGGSTNNSTSTGGTNNTGLLSVSGIDLSIGTSTTIIYEVYAKNTVEDGTVVNSIANVSDTPEGAIGGTPSVPVTIYAPKFTVSALEVDDNGGSLYNNEIITHNITLNNIGTSTGTNVNVTLTYSTGFTFSTGSFNFMSGTLANTGTLEINDSSRTITFIIPVMGSGVIETLNFKTIATGPVGSINKTTVNLTTQEGPGANGISNELVIVGMQNSGGGSGGGGGGGGGGGISQDICINGDYSGSYYDKICGTKPTQTQKDTKTPEDKKSNEAPKKLDTIKNNITQISKSNEINSIIKSVKEKKKKLEDIYEQENLIGSSNLKLPKILPKTGTPILNRVKRLKNDKLNLTVNEKDLTLAGNYNEDIDFWKKALPDIDKNSSEILVTPSNGMVIPIVKAENLSKDYKELINGGEIEVNKYLKGGAMKYPGTGEAGYGELGNSVIFGHSSYFKKDNGRYKTLFQKIIELDSGEEIWIYKKDDSGNYKRYVYTVEASYEVKPSQVDIMLPGKGKNITLFTCTPIGNINGRWVIKAKYLDPLKSKLEKELYGKGILEKHIRFFDNTINRIKKLDSEKKIIVIEKLFEILDTQKVKNIFGDEAINYFKLILAEEYQAK